MATIPPGAQSPYDVPDTDDTAFFSVATVEDGELVGEALLWGIDQHNRSAHVGLALRPSFRRRGWSGEVLELLCEYGFTVRGLNRLQLETAATNTAMLRAATRAGFNQEGRTAAVVVDPRKIRRQRRHGHPGKGLARFGIDAPTAGSGGIGSAIIPALFVISIVALAMVQ